jgi:hypothetical protein
MEILKYPHKRIASYSSESPHRQPDIGPGVTDEE